MSAGSTFGDETNHFARSIDCYWSARAEDAYSVARRIAAMVTALATVDPGLQALWPILSRRGSRPTDPGPVLDLSEYDLGRAIDRKCRFDPPQLPEPVSEWGYSVMLATLDDVELPAAFTVHAGRTIEMEGNQVSIGLRDDASVWRNLEMAKALLGVLIEAWNADHASATAAIARSSPEGKMEYRPWLLWTKASAGPYRKHWLREMGPPDEQSEWLGGELQVWR